MSKCFDPEDWDRLENAVKFLHIEDEAVTSFLIKDPVGETTSCDELNEAVADEFVDEADMDPPMDEEEEEEEESEGNGEED